MSEERTQRMPTLEKEQPEQSGQGGEHGLEQSASAAAYDPAGGGGEVAGTPSGRFWSARRVCAGIVSLLLLAALLLLLYDLVSVRAGRPGMAWRRTLADQLATTRTDSAVVLAGAAVAALLGLWLLLLAATPGQRSLLPMHGGNADVRAGLERSAAGLALRDRAMEVAGVSAVRVTVGRRKVRAKAQAHFRDLDEVRDDLDGALGDGIEQLGLTRRLGLSVHVRRPKKR